MDKHGINANETGGTCRLNTHGQQTNVRVYHNLLGDMKGRDHLEDQIVVWEENNKTLSLYGSNVFPHDHPYFQHTLSIGPIVYACTIIRTDSTTNFLTYVWECSLRLSGGSSRTQTCNSAYNMSIGCKMEGAGAKCPPPPSPKNFFVLNNSL
jgi:hypothetical protein